MAAPDRSYDNPRPPSERSSATLAHEMHDLSVHLWNALWREQGEDPEFVYRERVEAMQGLLSEVAWPDA